MEIDFSNKTVIVTGGTRGIGAAIVELLQECNAEIIVTGTNIKELERLNRKSKGTGTKYVRLDFTSNSSVQEFLGYIGTLDRIDVLINNAGVNKIDSIHEIDENDWDWINNVNLRGPFLLTRTVSKIMQKQCIYSFSTPDFMYSSSESIRIDSERIEIDAVAHSDGPHQCSSHAFP